MTLARTCPNERVKPAARAVNVNTRRLIVLTEDSDMEFFFRYKRIFIIAVVLLCAALMAYSAYYRTQPTMAEDALSYAVTPFQKAIKGVTDWFGGGIAFFGDAKETTEENIRLKEELDLLKIENARLTRIELDYNKLTEILQTRDQYSGYQTTGVRIIAKDPGIWYDNFLIDKGRKDGISANMVIIGVGGLVGRVTEAGYNYSKVRALVDDTFSVSAKSARTEDTGIVKGDMKLKEQGLCKMERIDISADILQNDEILTSNLGNIYPPGITIGYVREITINPDGLTKTAIIEPAADFRNLDVLLVITEVFDTEPIDKNPDEESDE